MNVFVVGAAIRESMSDTRMAADIAGTGLQTGFEEQNCASQIAARLIRNGQAHRAMRAEFPERFFNRLALATTNTQDRTIFVARIFKANPSPAATQIGFGDTADSLETSCLFSISSTTGCAEEAGSYMRLRGSCYRIMRRT
jgi:hypothetical protein